MTDTFIAIDPLGGGGIVHIRQGELKEWWVMPRPSGRVSSGLMDHAVDVARMLGLLPRYRGRLTVGVNSEVKP